MINKPIIKLNLKRYNTMWVSEKEKLERVGEKKLVLY
jgi:hypothetical protein